MLQLRPDHLWSLLKPRSSSEWSAAAENNGGCQPVRKNKVSWTLFMFASVVLNLWSFEKVYLSSTLKVYFILFCFSSEPIVLTMKACEHLFMCIDVYETVALKKKKKGRSSLWLSPSHLWRMNHFAGNSGCHKTQEEHVMHRRNFMWLFQR